MSCHASRHLATSFHVVARLVTSSPIFPRLHHVLQRRRISYDSRFITCYHVLSLLITIHHVPHPAFYHFRPLPATSHNVLPLTTPPYHFSPLFDLHLPLLIPSYHVLPPTTLSYRFTTSYDSVPFHPNFVPPRTTSYRFPPRHTTSHHLY